MAYTFGARLDDDSYALTTIDEDQGTATTKGEINGVPFEGGGGGSSDFSTAQMTVNDSVDHIMYGAFAVGIVGPDDPPPTTTGKVYTDEYDSFSVVMYKGMAAVEFEIDEQTTISATGSATVDRNYVIITGDCNITIS